MPNSAVEKDTNADILEIVKAEWDVGTSKKAFQINLDPKRYGTFAEIGAGQEVARRFFYVGGASGTIAKTMSAYDMTFSDAIYGPTDRYVSRVRLGTMLDHEYKLLIDVRFVQHSHMNNDLTGFAAALGLKTDS